MGSSRTRARTRVPCIGRRILNHCATREAPGVQSLNHGATREVTELYILKWWTFCYVNFTSIEKKKRKQAMLTFWENVWFFWPASPCRLSKIQKLQNSTKVNILISSQWQPKNVAHCLALQGLSHWQLQSLTFITPWQEFRAEDQEWGSLCSGKTGRTSDRYFQDRSFMSLDSCIFPN